MMRRFFPILILVASVTLAQEEIDCGFNSDLQSISVISGGYYAFDIQLSCDTYEVSEYGFTIWPSYSPFELDSLYNLGDRVIWGQNMHDTSAYSCKLPIPYLGITPLNHDSSDIYWSRIDSLALIELTTASLDSTEGIPLHIEGRVLYHNSLANEAHTIKSYFVDQFDSTHIYLFINRDFPLLFTGGQLVVEMSQDEWDFSNENNVFDEYCWTDTIHIYGRLTGYFNEPIRNAVAWIPAYDGLLISGNQQTSNSNGVFRWQVHFPSGFLPPVNPENCIPPNCDECEYPNFDFDLRIYSLGFQQFGSEVFYFLVQRSGGECVACSMVGDLNADLVFDLIDVTILIDLILQDAGYSEYEIWSGDINSDGNLNIRDVISLIERM